MGYVVDDKEYWVATSRFDLSAEDVALVYKLRWDIETFFGWWKRHLRVYHLIARSQHGLMVQILSGLITYLLLTIYCHEEHEECVSIRRVRELRMKIMNETRKPEVASANSSGDRSDQQKRGLMQFLNRTLLIETRTLALGDLFDGSPTLGTSFSRTPINL